MVLLAAVTTAVITVAKSKITKKLMQMLWDNKLMLTVIIVSIVCLFFAFIVMITMMTPMFVFAGQSALDGNEAYGAGYWASYDGEESSDGVFGPGPFFPIPREVKSNFSNSFGAGRVHNGKADSHEGIDIFAARNSPIISIEDCTIDKIGWNAFGGWRILATSKDGKRTYYYAHMENYAPKLQVYKDFGGNVASPGIEIKAGEVIGYVGSSGGFNSDCKPGNDTGTEPHLHFQLWTDGVLVNPYSFLTELSERMTAPAVKKLITPAALQYREIQADKLRAWLDQKRNSILSEEPYFSTVLKTAKEYNLNPFVMWAVLGQEESYVPRSWDNALKIAQNPFNVTQPKSGKPGAWYSYSPGIETSAASAARTIIRWSRDCPATENIFRWINRPGQDGGYAEDQNWWKGVESNFRSLEKRIGYLD